MSEWPPVPEATNDPRLPINGEPWVKCATCGTAMPGAMLAEHIKLMHIPKLVYESAGHRRPA
jgi:hypothetical protein